MASIEAIFFDLGDTISDLQEGQEAYTARVLTRGGLVHDALSNAGLTLPERAAFAVALAEATEAHYQAAVAAQRGTSVYEAMRTFLPTQGLPVTEDLVVVAGDAYCRAGTHPAPLRIGARAVLEGLRARGLKLGVISNTLQPGSAMDATLARIGIRDLFSACLYSSEVGFAKPHPVIFRAALDALDARPERSVHVGDRLQADIAGAQAAGMRAILIEVAHRPEFSDHIVPDARIRELPELLAVPFIASAFPQRD